MFYLALIIIHGDDCNNINSNDVDTMITMIKIRKDVFFHVTSVGQKYFLSPMSNRTSEHRIPRSNALPLSHRDSTVSEVHYEVYQVFLSVLKTYHLNSAGSLTNS